MFYCIPGHHKIIFIFYMQHFMCYLFHEQHEIRAKKCHSRASRKWSFYGHFVVACVTREWFLDRFLVNLYYS
jgi:hypothetical protein